MSQTDFASRLATLRANNCDQLPTPELAILTRTIARLRDSGIERKCLQQGETAPDFTFINDHNQRASLYDLVRNGPVVINFFRGFWCQYCQTEIEAYESIQAELAKIGCAYLAVTPQQPESLASTPDNYQVIYDKDNEIAAAFGIVYSLESEERSLFESWGLDLGVVNGADNWSLPIPATFVVRADRTIGYAYVDVDFRARCCPDQLIEEIRAFD